MAELYLPRGKIQYFPRGKIPPVTPLRTGESLPRIPLAGAEPRDGACGAGYVSGWLRLLVRCRPG
jgi:hypothetical protein